MYYVDAIYTQSNILISGEGKACLSDFGFSTLLAEFQGTSYFTSLIGGAVRWAAPEMYRIENDHIAPANTLSDIYSFGSVMLQVSAKTEMLLCLLV